MRQLGFRSIPIEGPPVNGTSEVQTITVDATGGTYTVVHQGFTSAAIAEAATAAALQAILEAMPSIGSGNVVVTGSAGGPYTLTFQGNLGVLAMALLTVTNNNLTGGASTAVVAESVAGVTATQRGSSPGTTLIDTVSKLLYQNRGTALLPMWDKANAPLSDAGLPADNLLRVDADVVSTETVTIGDDVYEVEIVNTDTTDDAANSDFVPVTNPLVVTDYATSYANSPATVGALIRIDNEIMAVSAVDGADVTLLRGVSGTTIATHADAADIYEGDLIAAGSTIAVGLVATLTPTAFTAALTDDINTRGTENIIAVNPNVNAVNVYTADAPGGTAIGSAAVTATTETLGGASNAWAAATLSSGRLAATRQQAEFNHTVTAAEVAVGEHRLKFPFTINNYITQAYTSAGVPKNNLTDQIVVENDNELVWDGTGAINPAAGDLLHGICWGI